MAKSASICFIDLILKKDPGYGNISLLISQLEEISAVLERYTASILDSGFWLLTSELLPMIKVDSKLKRISNMFGYPYFKLF